MEKIATMKVWAVDLGLAVHVEAPNGRYIVIDLGAKEGVEPLKSLVQKDVGYMVITHPHHDHFSDIKNIDYAKPKVLWRVKAYSREELMEGVRDSERNDFVMYCDFVGQYNQPIIQEREKPSSGIPFDGLSAKVFQAAECDKSNKNNFSAIVALQLGTTKVIICGDNEYESFVKLWGNDNFKSAVKNADVLIAPHHGRESGYCSEFVSLVSPKITIISDTSKVGTSVTNKYDEQTEGLDVYNCVSDYYESRKCLTTRKDGNIIVRFGENGNLNVYTHCP